MGDPTPTLHALRATTGETLWTSDAVKGRSGTPVVTAGLVIVAHDQAGSSGRLSAYRVAGCGASRCQPVWRTDVSPAPSGSAAVAGGVLYQGLADGTYAAIDAATGQRLWKAGSPPTGGRCPRRP
ncbi:MAG TPA: PQQ-binding-like beta-propeller repeat protein, partial [Acidimicrobiales bacterium]|nr:PQQ-binding-like beta-propeller repeat protein [Acidimicrobiales bacterium]